MRVAQGRILKFLSFVNWAVLTLAVLASLAGAVICLLIWPFPQVAADGPGLTDIWVATELGVGVTIVAALATWLTDKRHPLFWVAEIALAIAVAVALAYGIVSR
ncbi:hypothetical protein C41B8_02137 [Salinisphaera hydrothermalis C41B8]|uniref:Uncharacterized protein n=2 Tax=Salinisphaera TaxID=180541 RepID=A0A084IQA7_SALHC|nr:hypothetical protein C41B8_02137 [Salinisphaera hydrothermalis C41B8]